MYPSSVVHTGVKSFGWENNTPQDNPSHSWKRILPLCRVGFEVWREGTYLQCHDRLLSSGSRFLLFRVIVLVLAVALPLIGPEFEMSFR